MCNLYCIVLSNFGFTGQESGGLSFESAMTLLEIFLVTYEEGNGDTPLMSIVMAMLDITEEKILAMK